MSSVKNDIKALSKSPQKPQNPFAAITDPSTSVDNSKAPIAGKATDCLVSPRDQLTQFSFLSITTDAPDVDDTENQPPEGGTRRLSVGKNSRSPKPQSSTGVFAAQKIASTKKDNRNRKSVAGVASVSSANQLPDYMQQKSHKKVARMPFNSPKPESTVAGGKFY